MTGQPLSVPQILPRPGGWEFIWESADVAVRLERIREHHDSITAEFWAEQNLTQREHLYGGVRFALTTPAGRGSIIKALHTRRNGVDWGTMLEQVCVLSVQRFRAQDAGSVIGTLPTNRELKFVLRPVIPAGVTTLLFGYGGANKTTLALAWGLLVQLGEPRLGLEPTEGPVMLLDWETNQEIANSNLAMLHAGLELPGEPKFLYHRCRRPLVEFIEDLRAEVEREGIRLVILDCLSKACGGEKELKENALPTMLALEWLGTTNLVINHRARSEEGRGRGSYGSIMVENDARQAFRVSAHSAPDQPDQVLLEHYKHNLMGQLTPIGYSISRDKLSGTRIEVRDVGELEDIRGQLAAVYQIEAALKAAEDGRLTIEALVEETSLKGGTIRETLRRYKNKRFVNLGGQPIAWGLKMAETPEEFR